MPSQHILRFRLTNDDFKTIIIPGKCINKLDLTHPFNILLTFETIGYILAIYIFPYFCAKEMRVIIKAKQFIVYFNYSRVCLETYIHKMHFSPTQWLFYSILKVAISNRIRLNWRWNKKLRSKSMKLILAASYQFVTEWTFMFNERCNS